MPVRIFHYADSNYMNDIWSFNATTMEWREVRTTGDIPQNRSNCTMNYDSQNNRYEWKVTKYYRVRWWGFQQEALQHPQHSQLGDQRMARNQA